MGLFDTVSGTELQAARVLTGATMAAFLSVGLVPALRPHAGRIRAVLLVLYLVACIAFVGVIMLR
ncbi:MAG TPA: hypothetical protein VFL55_03305 [Acetobacteraceae bacterium]|nr:hypothetical protein [Acetobacteraceae bacterium]